MGEIITYKNQGEKGVYSQMKLDNGRVLISIAEGGVKIFKLRFGVIPGQVLWEHSDLISFVKSLEKNGIDDHPLDAVVNQVKSCSSLQEVQPHLNEFLSTLG